MLNKEQVVQVEFSCRVPWEAVSKQQRAAFTGSSALLSPVSILQAAFLAGDQSCYDTAARIWLWYCPHQNGLCSASTAGSGSTTDRGATEKAHSDTFIIPTAYYSKWHWNISYTPSPSPHSHHQTKLTSVETFGKGWNLGIFKDHVTLFDYKLRWGQLTCLHDLNHPGLDFED